MILSSLYSGVKLLLNPWGKAMFNIFITHVSRDYTIRRFLHRFLIVKILLPGKTWNENGSAMNFLILLTRRSYQKTFSGSSTDHQPTLKLTVVFTTLGIGATITVLIWRTFKAWYLPYYVLGIGAIVTILVLRIYIQGWEN